MKWVYPLLSVYFVVAIAAAVEQFNVYEHVIPSTDTDPDDAHAFTDPTVSKLAPTTAVKMFFNFILLPPFLFFRN